MTKSPLEKPGARERVVQIDYTNHEGIRSIRTILPSHTVFTDSEHHPGDPQWFWLAYCLDRKANRLFAINDIHSWRGRPLPPLTVIRDIKTETD